MDVRSNSDQRTEELKDDGPRFDASSRSSLSHRRYSSRRCVGGGFVACSQSATSKRDSTRAETAPFKSLMPIAKVNS
jgi:hypothetical protein